MWGELTTIAGWSGVAGWGASVVGVVLLADLTSGAVHWLEDAYARPDMRWVGRIAEENLLHHTKPRDFLKKNWWQSSYDLIAIGLVITLLVWLCAGAVSGWFILFMVLSVNANQIHKWAHQNRDERPRWVSTLQDAGIMQGPRQHGRHHRGAKNTDYCVITNVLNPVLERVHFWVGLEQLIYRLTGVARRQDEGIEQVVKSV